MKTILALFVSVMATTANAETTSEIRSKSIDRILKTPMLKEFFKNDDGSMGSLTGIKYVNSATTDVADNYEITLSGQNGSMKIDCTLLARVDGNKGKGAITFQTPKCAESQIFPESKSICQKPSATGCLD